MLEYAGITLLQDLTVTTFLSILNSLDVSKGDHFKYNITLIRVEQTISYYKQERYLLF